MEKEARSLVTSGQVLSPPGLEMRGPAVPLSRRSSPAQYQRPGGEARSHGTRGDVFNATGSASESGVGATAKRHYTAAPVTLFIALSEDT